MLNITESYKNGRGLGFLFEDSLEGNDLPSDFFSGGAVPDDVEIKAPSPEEKNEANRYEGMDIRQKRLNLVYDISTGNVDAKLLPPVLKIYSKFISKLPDGRFLLKSQNLTPSEKGLYTKFLKFLGTGQTDALTSVSSGIVKKVITQIASEINRSLSLQNDHPSRTLQRMTKSGKIKDSILFHLKKYHMDVFGDEFIKYLNPHIINKIFELRNSEFKKSSI